jgi:hypothetical protein
LIIVVMAYAVLHAIFNVPCVILTYVLDIFQNKHQIPKYIQNTCVILTCVLDIFRNKHQIPKYIV